ncbi:hypothetical protein [Actinomadura citrea]|uniref:hypothetical protein n=1 Tax=Actinomadura citrea TaxID=46158 RepID=UPI0039A6C8D6
MKNDVSLGEHRWLTVVSPKDPEGTNLLLETRSRPAVKPFKEALAASLTDPDDRPPVQK